MKKWVLAVFFLILSASGCNPSAAQATPLKIAVLPVLDVLPLYVAQQQGYFEKAGVTVELVRVASAPERDQLMQAGQVDGMLNETVTTLFYNKEQPRVKIVRFARTATNQYPLFRILAAKDSLVQTPADLAGAQVAISNGTVIEYLTDRLLEKSGVNPGEIEKVSVPKIDERMALLEAGKLDAAVLPDPVASLSIQKGARVILDDTVYPEFSNSVYTFSIQTIEKRPEDVKAFLKAVEQAVQDINADKTRWNDLLTEQKLVPQPLLASYQLPDFPTAGVPSETQFFDALSWAMEKGLITKPLEYKDCVNAGFLP